MGRDRDTNILEFTWRLDEHPARRIRSDPICSSPGIATRYEKHTGNLLALFKSGCCAHQPFLHALEINNDAIRNVHNEHRRPIGTSRPRTILQLIASITFALVAAVLFSLAILNQKSALSHLDDLTGTFISVATMAALFWLIAAWSLRWEFWFSDAVFFFVIAGLLFPAMGQRFQIAAVKHVGPTLTSAFGAFLPLFATVPAILFLGEVVTPMQLLGIALLVGGLLLAAIARGVSWRKRAFYLLLLPLGAALVRAITQPLTKAGYNLLAEPLFATLVMTSISTLVLGIMVITVGSPRRVVSLGKGHALFALNGLLVGSGILGLQLSLISGSVSLTSSLVSTTPIWTLVLGVFLFKNERLQWWHSAVAIMVCVGAILVVTGQAHL